MYSTVLLLFSIKSVYMDGEKMTIKNVNGKMIIYVVREIIEITINQHNTWF